MDLHAITLFVKIPQELREQTYRALGHLFSQQALTQKTTTLFVQSHVSEHAELGWIFNCFAYMGELSRMTQFKDKSANKAKHSAGLFTYPPLWQLIFFSINTHLVPVGEDQKQHLEITRDIAIRMNHIYGKDLFTVPEIYTPPVGARIMSLQNPNAKMSKSDPIPMVPSYLTDTDDQIEKLKRAVTIQELKLLMRIKARHKKSHRYSSGDSGKIRRDRSNYQGKQYGHLKVDTAEIIVKRLVPFEIKPMSLLMADQKAI